MRRREFIAVVGGAAIAGRWRCMHSSRREVAGDRFSGPWSPPRGRPPRRVPARMQRAGLVSRAERVTSTTDVRRRVDRLLGLAGRADPTQGGCDRTGGNSGSTCSEERDRDHPRSSWLAPDPVGDGLVASLNDPAGTSPGCAALPAKTSPNNWRCCKELSPRSAVDGLPRQPDQSRIRQPHKRSATSAARCA